MGKRIEHRIINGVECKHCYKCGEWLPLSEFSKCKKSWDGFAKSCKKCKSKEDHDYYLKHQDKIKTNVKVYSENHKEEVKIKQHEGYLRREKKRKENIKYTVYLRTNIVNGMQYVGQTENFVGRENDWNCLSTRYANKLLTEDRLKYGLENWTVDILAIVDSRKEAWELEQKYIKELNTIFPHGYNLAKGGGGASGIAAWNKGVKGCFKDDTIKKMSEAKIGYIPWNKGKKNCISDETRQKMSEAKKGKSNFKLAIPVVQLTKDEKFITSYPSSAEAAKHLGMKSGAHISDCCKGKRNICANSKWMYKNDYETMMELNIVCQ